MVLILNGRGLLYSGVLMFGLHLNVPIWMYRVGARCACLIVHVVLSIHEDCIRIMSFWPIGDLGGLYHEICHLQNFLN